MEPLWLSESTMVEDWEPPLGLSTVDVFDLADGRRG